MPLTHSNLIIFRSELYWLLYYSEKYLEAPKIEKRKVLGSIAAIIDELPFLLPFDPEEIDANLVIFEIEDHLEHLWESERQSILNDIKGQQENILNFLTQKNNLKSAFYWIYGNQFEIEDIELMFKSIKKIRISPLGNGANKIALKLDFEFTNPQLESEDYSMIIKIRRQQGSVPASEINISNLISGKNFPVFGVQNGKSSADMSSMNPIWIEQLIKGKTSRSLARGQVELAVADKAALLSSIAKKIIKGYFFFFYDTLEMSTFISDPNTGNILLVENETLPTLESDFKIAEVGSVTFKVDVGKVSSVESSGNIINFLEKNGFEFFNYLESIHESSIKQIEAELQIGNENSISLKQMMNWILEEIESPLERLILVALIHKGIGHKTDIIWNQIELILNLPENDGTNRLIREYDRQLSKLEAWQNENKKILNQELLKIEIPSESAFKPITLNFKWLGELKILNTRHYNLLLGSLTRISGVSEKQISVLDRSEIARRAQLIAA